MMLIAHSHFRDQSTLTDHANVDYYELKECQEEGKWLAGNIFMLEYLNVINLI